jgi:putative nucleotidyltransferase with HDIG domain
MATQDRPAGRLLRLWAYRVGQAIAGTFGRLDPAAAAAATAELPANLRPLFLSMRPRDQRHAIGVLRRLGPAPDVLRQAALLHDVGKVQAYLGTPGRTLVVLAGSTGTTGLVRRVPGIGPRVERYVAHPAIGAEMLRGAGASADLVEIVAEHQEKRPRRPETVRLQAADGRE